MAEVTCPSPFSATGSPAALLQMEVACPDNRAPIAITWNPADKGPHVTLSESDLRADSSYDGNEGLRATTSKSSGKWYWEIKILAKGTLSAIGIGSSGSPLNCEWGKTGDAYGYSDSGWKNGNGGATSYGNPYYTNDIVGVAFDLTAGKIWFAKNNVWQASGDPAAGTNEAFSGISGTYFPGASIHGDSDIAIKARFNAEDQSYIAPAGFEPLEAGASPFIAKTLLSVSEIYAGYVDLGEAFSTVTSFAGASVQQEIIAGATSATTGGQANTRVEISGRALQAVSSLSCDHCFNYAQIDATCPTPTCRMSATFRYARIEAEVPTPTAGFRVGKRIDAECTAPVFTCTAYSGRNPSIIANAVTPTCSMRVGLSLSVEAGAPIPTCTIVADTHHLATVYGRVPAPLITCDADTENITIISASAPCPRGLFTTTIGNVADIYGRVSCPTCSMLAVTGAVVKLEGRVPVPGSLVRFNASLANVSITLEGDVPVPTMTSSVLCSLPSLVLRHERGEVQ